MNDPTLPSARTRITDSEFVEQFIEAHAGDIRYRPLQHVGRPRHHARVSRLAFEVRSGDGWLTGSAADGQLLYLVAAFAADLEAWRFQNEAGLNEVYRRLALDPRVVVNEVQE